MNFLKSICTQGFFNRSIRALDLRLKPSGISFQTCFYSNFTPYSRCLVRNGLDLTSKSFVLVPVCGMKVRGQLQLRCKDCYFERKDGQLYVFCTSYPRHKQMALRKREKYTWILTHATQSKLRPY